MIYFYLLIMYILFHQSIKYLLYNEGLFNYIFYTNIVKPPKDEDALDALISQISSMELDYQKYQKAKCV